MVFGIATSFFSALALKVEVETEISSTDGLDAVVIFDVYRIR